MKRAIFLMVILGLIPSLSFAKITQKELKEEEYEIIIVKKGDTLWDLAGKYIGRCQQWLEFERYNQFTNPHLIYPGEKLAIGIKDGKLVIRRVEELEAELKAKIKKKDEEIAKLSEEIEKLKLAPKEKEIIKEIIYDKEREEVIEAILLEREEFEKGLYDLKNETGSIRKEIDALAVRLSQTEERLDLTEGILIRERKLIQRKEKELQEVREEKEQIAKEEKIQRRYKEILAISVFVGIVIANSLR
ncbi:TPA: hypothetical protein DCX16_03285 [bacterium]|nr:hypothetical protein [bacterium]